MTDTDPDLTPRAERRAPIERDHYGRPKVLPPGGKKPVAYSRCTTFIKCIEDTSTLERWGKRMVLVGASHDPSITQRAAWESDKGALDALAEDALVAAKAHEKRDKGTYLHLLSEHVDRDEDLPEDATAADRADMDAYQHATWGLNIVLIERFSVLDEFRVAGTPDRLVRVGGQNYIADLKTGRVDYGALTIAMQLAVYSRSVLYDHVEQTRADLPNVNQDRAIVIHLPAGSATCELHWVRIDVGWQNVLLAREIRNARGLKQKHLFTPFTAPQPDLWAVS